jgi:hypothetical protein
MYKVLSIIIVIIFAMAGATAQTKLHRRQHSEADNVVVRIDLRGAEADASYPRTSYSYPVEDFKPGVVRVGPRTTYLKEGLRTDEVVGLLGKPVSISERNADGLVVTIYAFQRGEGRILIAEFLSGVLVRSWIETRDEQVVKADR